MKLITMHRRRIATLVLCLAFGIPWAQAQEARTVIGPKNVELARGADALLGGDATEGVRLTLAGLAHATSKRERHTAWSNLCAGYVMLEDLENALSYCNQVLEQNDKHWRAYSNRALVYVKMKRYDEAEQDLQRGEKLAPKSRTLQAVRAMWLDAIEPVAPNIVIDDRRQPPEDKAVE